MDGNIFMMCKQVNRQAFSSLPPGFAVRTLRQDELDTWKAMPFDDNYTAEQAAYMDAFFRITYAAQEATFFARTLVVCDPNDQIVGTCFLWKAYGLFNTVHWFKVVKAYEGRGIGRALLSILFQGVTDADLPIYLHTQPESFRAIKLYSDFGFELLTDQRIGQRDNHIEQCLPFLQAQMPRQDYEQLRFTTAPAAFIAGMARQKDAQF
ncbi:MAG: GNAT family N-acetyltransferase [Caldilinea sp. CFX5]|nr:GNAT family N-acetyltransferase [Caldilinea sp. CFX5]